MFSRTNYTFELVKNINATNINVITNNIFRLIEKNGIYEKSEGLMFCLRYSKTKDRYVIDFGTKSELDIQGICLNNYKNLKSETKKSIFLRFIQSYEEILNSSYLEDYFKLKSFSNRCITFVNNNTENYIVGLCTLSDQRKANKPIKIKNFFFENNDLLVFKYTKNLCKEEFKYRKCLNHLKRCKSFNLDKPKLKYKDFVSKNYKDNDWSIVYDYCLYTHEFINNNILSKKSDSNLLVYDHVTKKIISIPSNFYKKEFNLPESVIESNNYLLLPKVY